MDELVPGQEDGAFEEKAVVTGKQEEEAALGRFRRRNWKV